MEGCPSILGIWVPLNCAQKFVQSQSSVPGLLTRFLLNALYEDFPSSIQNLYRSHAYLRSLQQLGPPFRSMVERRLSLSIEDAAEQTEGDTVVPPLFEGSTLETPLSVKEEEIFQTLCACSDWDEPSPGPFTERKPEKRKVQKRPPMVPRSSRTTKAPPLRRSRRVAEALASRCRTRKNRT